MMEICNKNNDFYRIFATRWGCAWDPTDPPHPYVCQHTLRSRYAVCIFLQLGKEAAAVAAASEDPNLTRDDLAHIDETLGSLVAVCKTAGGEKTQMLKLLTLRSLEVP